MTAPEQMRACPTPWCSHDCTPYTWQGPSDHYTVICEECQVEGPYCATESDAIAAWNTRPAPAELVEALRPLADAPKNADWILGWFKEGWTVRPIPIHWAEDLSGEEQPPFRGWFRWAGEGGFAEQDMANFLGWEPVSEEAARTALRNAGAASQVVREAGRGSANG